MPDTLISVPSRGGLVKGGDHALAAARVLMRGTPFVAREAARGRRASILRLTGLWAPRWWRATPTASSTAARSMSVGWLISPFDLVDEPPDTDYFALGWRRVRASPLIDSFDSGGEAMAGAQQVVEVDGHVGEVGELPALHLG